ncbi:low molecular weight protein-tyrosine-phosphatase [Aurantiacibacter gangjinensis]|uniref:protein-tyrosine-phosphatase n=1 Tax=Aurantiacibacter gangjinensis TaxID=502682 RepID=A0A0G9MMP4_9SPHN|nr:low molecular weight protein-tyrosine-phosphatase [Aurantiacibacter gangjinensis]APE27937.1 Low molecular weight protein tyrosine phosphatase [Aurantiacibacter gangjinensis]KLE31884.1 phosphotyrosine protein phosphatase [Aurantiacibacter gangjinensis]
MSDRPAILFVCLGNICRSPLAEGAMRAAAEEAGVDVDIDSAGTGAWHVGNPPDERSIAVARANGVDISRQRARQVEPADFVRFTHIYALDADNLANLRRLAPPDTTARVALLMDVVAGSEGQAVADPYYGGAEGFSQTWADVNRAAQALVRQLLR